MLCIKNFAKSKKFFFFHGIFKNDFFEIFFIIFYFVFILLSFIYLKNQIDFTRQNEKYEDIDFESRYLIFEKNKYRKEDIILNRFLVINFLIFLFRSYFLQNFFRNPLTIKILFFFSFLVFFSYVIFIIFKKSEIRIFFIIVFINEIIFLIYFSLGIFEFFIPNLVLDFFYCSCYIGKVIENIFIGVLVFQKNKKKKIKNKKNIQQNKKNFIFDPNLTIKIDKESFYYKELLKMLANKKY